MTLELYFLSVLDGFSVVTLLLGLGLFVAGVATMMAYGLEASLPPVPWQRVIGFFISAVAFLYLSAMIPTRESLREAYQTRGTLNTPQRGSR